MPKSHLPLNLHQVSILEGPLRIQRRRTAYKKTLRFRVKACKQEQVDTVKDCLVERGSRGTKDKESAKRYYSRKSGLRSSQEAQLEAYDAQLSFCMESTSNQSRAKQA